MKPRKAKAKKTAASRTAVLSRPEYAAFSAPGSAEFPSGQTSKPRKAKTTTKYLPINWLLGCTKADLDNFELARMAEVSDLREELHAIMDRVIDTMAQAALVAWFKEQDRQSLKHAIENEESPEEWARRMIRNRGRSEEEIGEDGYLFPRPSLPSGAAHLAAAVRYQERNIAEGKCCVCPEPLDRNSVRFCTKHLAAARHRDARKHGVKGEPGTADYLYGEITESTHGRTPGTLRSLEMNREKKTRALLAELGIPPESAAVSKKAAIDALLKVMPGRKHAMTQAELFEKAGVITKATGQRALADLLAEGKIKRIGRGGMRDVYRYFALKD